MKIWQISIPFGVAILSAVAADWVLYAIGVGGMHAIGTYQGRGWMGNMTFPGWSFIAGLAGCTAVCAWLFIRKRIRAGGIVVAILLFVVCFLPLCRLWFCNPRFHDSVYQRPPGWLMGTEKESNPNTPSQPIAGKPGSG
jgi:hypothetical protein